jgi:hypothetical protein
VGYAVFDDDDCTEFGQFPYTDWQRVFDFFSTGTPPDVVVFERFALYPSRAAAQSWSEFPAVQVIGALRLLCAVHKYPIFAQPPSLIHADGGLSPILRSEVERIVGRGKPHAKDAVAHGLYWLRYGSNRGERSGVGGTVGTPARRVVGAPDRPPRPSRRRIRNRIERSGA